MKTIERTLLSSLPALVFLLLTISCSQEDKIFTGPFLIKDGVTYDQDTNKPVTGIALLTSKHGRPESRTTFKDGIRNGPEHEFRADGSLRSIRNYSHGVLEGGQEDYYPDGQLQYRYGVAADQYDGLMEKFHENGQLHWRQSYREGRKKGLYEEFNWFGKLVKTATYDNGVEVD